MQTDIKKLKHICLCRNQSDVGEGLKKSGVKREDAFLVSKLWTNGYESCRDEFTSSLKQWVIYMIIQF